MLLLLLSRKEIFFWINNLFINETQKEIIHCMVFYFVSKLASIGIQNEYEKISNDNNLRNDMLMYILNFYIIFTIFTFILYFFSLCKSSTKQYDEIKLIYEEEQIISFGDQHYLKDTLLKIIKKFDVNFIGIFIILFVIISCGFIHSLIILLRGFFEIHFLERNSISIIITMNEYFIFLMNYYCLIIAENQIDNEFQTIIITIYLSICDYIIYFIELILGDAPNLFLFQFIICSCLGILFIIIILRWIVIFCSLFIGNRYGVCSYLNGKFICHICCCKTDSLCHSECCTQNCSVCNCSYLCCQPCSKNLYNLILSN